jgi:hypothetical protein
MNLGFGGFNLASCSLLVSISHESSPASFVSKTQERGGSAKGAVPCVTAIRDWAEFALHACKDIRGL